MAGAGLHKTLASRLIHRCSNNSNIDIMRLVHKVVCQVVLMVRKVEAKYDGLCCYLSFHIIFLYSVAMHGHSTSVHKREIRA